MAGIITLALLLLAALRVALLKVKGPTLPTRNFRPIDPEQYGWMIAHWQERAAFYGISAGPVVVVSQRSGDPTFWAFALINNDMFRKSPMLLVQEGCEILLAEEVAIPAIEHELGHQRLGLLAQKHFFGLISIPVTILAYLCSEVMASTERFLFWGSVYAMAHFEEYAADALMAEAVGERDAIYAFHTLKVLSTIMGISEPTERERYLCSHPTTEKRICAIRELFD